MESNGYYSVNTLVHKFPNHTLRDRHVLQGNDARLSLVWVEVVWQNNNIQPVEFLAFDMASVKGSGHTEASLQARFWKFKSGELLVAKLIA